MPSLDFNLKDVLPLLSSLGIGGGDKGDAPTEDAKPSTATVPAMPPSPPPPVPAAAGFGDWAADPQNAKKVADGLTAPGTPLLPPAPVPPMIAAPPPAPSDTGLVKTAPSRVLTDPSVLTPPPGRQFASLNPPQVATQNAAPSTATVPTQDGLFPAPMPSAPLPTAAPTVAQAAQTQMNLDMAANPDQYQRPQLAGQGWKGFLRFGIPAALISAGSGLNRQDPSAGMKLIEDQMAADKNVPNANLTTFNARNVQPLRDAAALADTQSQTAQRNSTAAKADRATEDMAPFTMTLEQAKAINQPGLAGTQTTMRDYNKLVGKAGDNNTSAGNNQRTNDTKETNNAATNQTRLTASQQAIEARKGIAAEADKTRMLVASMHDRTSRANNADTNASKGGGSSTSAQGFKVPADVTKRAALASNVLENAQGVEDILGRRSDITGTAGGRYSNVQQMIGSDDPDIQALGVRMHNMALASNGAHGVRSQEAVQKTEDELFNHFKSGPNAIHGALNATRGSMQTFLDDERNFATTGQRTSYGVTAPPARAGGNAAPASYTTTATGPGGHQIGSNDGGKTWVDVKTGKKVQ